MCWGIQQLDGEEIITNAELIMIDVKDVGKLRIRVINSGAPEALQSGAPYSYRKVGETHELICSWLSWLAVLRPYSKK